MRFNCSTSLSDVAFLIASRSFNISAGEAPLTSKINLKKITFNSFLINDNLTFAHLVLYCRGVAWKKSRIDGGVGAGVFFGEARTF